MNDFDSVGEFHQKFGLPRTTETSTPRSIQDDVRDFRLRFLLEELEELAEGYGLELQWTLAPCEGATPNLAKIADALIDLSYVTLGTAHMHQLPWAQLFAEVQRANMSKERAAQDGSNSARKSSLDVVKPEGWKAPDIISILVAKGWRGPELPFGK